MILPREESISLAERLSAGNNLAELQYAGLLYDSLARSSEKEEERKYYLSIARKIETELLGS